jgi:F-type H+-transporting ATPase subunit a
MDLDTIAEHVKDSPVWHLPGTGHDGWTLPRVFGFQLTKLMVLELIVALLMLLIFIPLARRMRTGEPPRGRLWNMLEAVLLFLRDEVARPAIGQHDADRFLPFIWNIFFFILFCNLVGLVPWSGSPTGSLSVTAALAAVTFLAVVGTGMLRFGFVGFFKSLVPPMELPLLLKIPLVGLLVFPIEVGGLLIRHAVLAVRLLANMFAGHLVLAVILSFIIVALKSTLVLFAGVTVASVLGATALSLLELFVAFLQAYIFAFLSALFIGMAVHPH